MASTTKNQIVAKLNFSEATLKEQFLNVVPCTQAASLLVAFLVETLWKQKVIVTEISEDWETIQMIIPKSVGDGHVGVVANVLYDEMGKLYEDKMVTVLELDKHHLFIINGHKYYSRTYGAVVGSFIETLKESVQQSIGLLGLIFKREKESQK